MKEILKDQNVDFSDERTYYNPKFFEKITNTDGKKATYTFKPRRVDPSDENSPYVYWQMREDNAWPSVPRIYEDDCQAFY